MNRYDEPSEADTMSQHNEASRETTKATRLLDEVAVFHYVTAPNAPTYRAIMQIFHEAKEHYTVDLRPAQVLAGLQQSVYHAELPDEDALNRALDQLVDWGNLARIHDTAAVARIGDFYRRRHLYHLTAIGEAAHRAVREVEATLGKTGSLQTAMLVKIRDTLRSLAELAESGRRDDADALYALLHDLHGAFDTLTQEASRFLGALGHRDSERMAEERFELYKRAVLNYVSRFVDQLRRLGAEIAIHVRACEAAGIADSFELAVRAANLPPAPDGRDPQALWVAEWRAKWEGVRTWFIGGTQGAESSVERFATKAVGAVVELMRFLSRLNDRRTRPVDRAADYRTLARWFAICTTDEQAHGLWQAATGLYAGRHFHIAEEDEDLVAPSTSWLDAAPVAVPIRLRTHGSSSAAGRAAPAQDYSADKQWIAQMRRREREQVAAATRRFAGHGCVDFRAIERLDAAEFDLLLSLLDQALGAPADPGGVRQVRTADGRLLVTLHPPATDADAATATIDTPRGRLRCRNYRIEVRDAFAAARSVRAQEGGA